jgi:CopG family transcriptional regulator, nickel-responsive regulator
MTKLVRFGVSLEKELLEQLDRLLREKGYSNRSEAIRGLIRGQLVVKEWKDRKTPVVGAISLVYDHHRRELVNKLTSLQHDFGGIIIASQHIHIDHNNCLEIIAVKGLPQEIQALADRMRATKGVKHGELAMTTTGSSLE